MTEKTLLDLSKLQLKTGMQKGSKYPPSLKVGLYQNNPQLTVYTNVDGAPRNGMITAGMDMHTLFIVFDTIRRVIDEPTGEESIVYEIENKFKPKDSRELQVKNKTIVGKDKEGVVFISVVDNDSSMPKIKFDFGVNFYHSLERRGGTSLTKGEVSQRSATAWVDMFSRIVSQIAVDTYAPVERGGYGGGNKSGGNNNSRNNTSDISEDDMPF